MNEQTPQQGQPQVVVNQSAPQSNGMGIAGFVVSLIGLISCGLLSPIGLLLSLIGVFKKPRGMAVAGLIISIVGTAFLVISGLSIVLGFFGLKTAFEAEMANVAFQNSERAVEAYYMENGSLPTAEQAQAILPNADELDTPEAEDMPEFGKNWVKRFIPKYEAISGTEYRIILPGEDLEYGTEDDLTKDYVVPETSGDGDADGTGEGDTAEPPSDPFE